MNMITTLKTDKQSLYNALLSRNPTYDGFAFVCVKTTKIFCRLSCSARKPLEQNIEFVFSVNDAQSKGFRACKICKPLQETKKISDLTQKFLAILKSNPNKKWDGTEIKKYGIDESTLRRSFNKDFCISFLKFAREHRLGSIVTNIENGNPIIDAQLDSGYESSSGFVDAIKKQIGHNPKNLRGKKILSAQWLETPIGPMLAIVDDEGLYLLEFSERKGLPKEIETLTNKIGPICFRSHKNIDILEKELNHYFKTGECKFSLPIRQLGTKFENSVWEILKKIPIGQTRSYLEQAIAIGNKNATRAVARANGANKIAIIIPCHRVIGSDGSMTGYGGKIWRKEWLLAHEAKMRANS